MYLPIYQSVNLSIDPSISFSCLVIWLIISLSICLSVCLCLSICLSGYLFFHLLIALRLPGNPGLTLYCPAICQEISPKLAKAPRLPRNLHLALRKRCARHRNSFRQNYPPLILRRFGALILSNTFAGLTILPKMEVLTCVIFTGFPIRRFQRLAPRWE